MLFFAGSLVDAATSRLAKAVPDMSDVVKSVMKELES